MSAHGLPCWYELASPDTTSAQAFYAQVLGWRWADSGTPGMVYLLASMGEAMVAGMMPAEPGQPVGWTSYFAVDNCDETADLAKSLGATVIVPPADIPGTGRFSVLIDPQGAGFALLQPLPGGTGGAFDLQKNGHGNWNELISRDAVAGLAFYGRLFGWTVSRTMQMGPDMTYHLIAREGVEIGGAFSAPGRPYWKPYFGVASVKGAGDAVMANGGKVLRGPDPVPGGAFTLQIEDAQGIPLALVGQP
jgi:uncharacterized protein